MKTILLNDIQNLNNGTTEFLISALWFVIGFGFWYAVLMSYHNYYLEKQSRKNESNHQNKMKKWK